MLDFTSLQWHCRSFAELSVEELYGILKLRQDVFIIEQNCLYADIDELDEQCQHVYAVDRKRIKAYLRCIPPANGTEPALGRVLVAEDARRRGIARVLMQRGIAYLQNEYPGRKIKVAAQCYLQMFYESLGFVRTSEPYMEDGIAHIDMHLEPVSLSGY